MHKDEQEPGTESIDHSSASTSEEAASSSAAAPTVQVHVKTDRIPLVSATNWTTGLISSAVIAVVMLISFLIGVETIFPGPPQPPAPAEAPAATAPSTADAPESAATAPKATTEESTPPAPSEPTKDTKDPAPSTDSTDSSKESAPAKEADATTPSKTSLRGGSDGAVETAAAQPLLLSRLARSSAMVSADPSESEADDDRPGFFSRIVLYIKFFILVCLSAILASVVLGGLALVVDRPLGDFKAAVSRVILCCWISTLALFVPAPEAWLRDLIHYAVAAVLFWIMGMLILKLSPRLSGALLGGTVALLAATAIGSRIVVWATW